MVTFWIYSFFLSDIFNTEIPTLLTIHPVYDKNNLKLDLTKKKNIICDIIYLICNKNVWVHVLENNREEFAGNLQLSDKIIKNCSNTVVLRLEAIIITTKGTSPMIFFSNRKTYLHLGACLWQNVLDYKGNCINYTVHLYANWDWICNFFFDTDRFIARVFYIKKNQKSWMWSHWFEASRLPINSYFLVCII